MELLASTCTHTAHGARLPLSVWVYVLSLCRCLSLFVSLSLCLCVAASLSVSIAVWHPPPPPPPPPAAAALPPSLALALPEACCGVVFPLHQVKAGYLKADKTLPWCARVEMVLSFFGMLRVLDQAKIMRCDFKPDQICI